MSEISETINSNGKAALNQSDDAKFFLATIIESLQDSIVSVDFKIIITSWNKGAERLYGYRAEEVIGKPLTMLTLPEDLEQVLANIESIRLGKDVQVYETERVHKDGHRIHLSITLSPVKNDKGEIIGVSTVARDISERKQAEEKLHFLVALNQSLQTLSEPDEIMSETARMLGEHLGVNRCAYAEVFEDEDSFRITGDYRRDTFSIVGEFKMSDFGAEALRLMRENVPYIVTDVEQDPRTQEHLESYRQTDIAAVISVPLHKNGRFVAGMAVHQKVWRQWTKGEIELVELVINRCWESIERARTVRNLRQSEERFRALVNQATAGITQTDATGKFIFANERYCEIVGYSHEELLNMRMQDISDPEIVPANVELYKRIWTDGTPFVIEKQYIRKDGSSVWVNNSVAPVVGASGKTESVVCVTIEITKRKLLETQISGQNRIFEALALGKPLEEILNLTIEITENQIQDSRCSVLLANESGTLLLPGSAPNLPSEYACVPGGVPIAENSGSCGTAAFRRERVIVRDIAEDLLWADCREEALKHNLRACWSHPVLSPEGKLYGTFATFFPYCREPKAEELRFLEAGARIVGIAIERRRSEEKLRESEARFRNLSNSAPVLIWVNGIDGCEYVNQQYLDFLGVKDAQDVRGIDWAEFIHPDDRNEYVNSYLEAFEKRERFFSQFRFRRYDGEYRWMTSIGMPRFSESDDFLGYVGSTIDVHDAKMTEEALRESEERLRLATEAAQMFAWETDFRTGKTKWSENAFDLIGYSGHEMLTDDADALFFVLPEERERVHSIFEQALANGENSFTAEFRGYNRSNEIRIWLTQSAIIKDENNVLIRGIGVTQDITERKKAEEKLREQQGILSLAMSSSQMGAWSRDLITDEVFWSPELEAIFGLPPGTFSDTRAGFLNYVYEEDKEQIKQEINNAIKERRGYRVEFRYHHADGSLRWMEGRGQAVYSEDGKPIKSYGIGIDITERKRAELNIEFLAEINQDLIKVSTPEEIVQTVGEHLNSFLGASMCAFVEISEDTDSASVNYDWHQADVSSLVGVYELDDFASTDLRQIAKSGTPVVIKDVRTETSIPDKELWSALKIGAHLNIPLIRNDKWRFSLCVYHREAYNWREDELELMRELAARLWARLERAFAEQERELVLKREHAARVQAEQANRLKDEFLATISHELRTPLNAILGWSQMLTSGKLDQNSVTRAIETIYRNAKSQAQIIEDILDVSRIITGKLKIDAAPITLAPVIQTVVESLRPSIEAKSIRLHMGLDFESRTVYADSERMQQVIWNLLSNAIKFTPERGQITIELETSELETKIIVSDTGKGIIPDFLPFVFDRFRQADGSTTRKHGGLGLGLSIVRHLVELHGGAVEVKSEGEGKGATFTVRLPLSETHLDGHAKSNRGGSRNEQFDLAHIEDAIQHNELKGKRILLIDDEKDTLELLAAVLSENGIEVKPHSTVHDALETLKDWKPDIIISDIAMPEEDGYSFIRKLRALPTEEGGGIPAVALTAYVGIKERTQVLSSGFQLYVPKPIEPSELLTALESLV